MAWDTSDSDEFVSGAEVKTVGQIIFLRQDEVAVRGMTYTFDNKDVTTSLVPVVTKKVRMPAWAVSGATVTLRYRYKRDGSGSSNVNTRLVVGSDTGGAGGIAPTPSWQYADVSVTLTSSLAGTMVDVSLDAQRVGGTADSNNDIDGKNLAMNLSIS